MVNTSYVPVSPSSRLPLPDCQDTLYLERNEIKGSSEDHD